MSLQREANLLTALLYEMKGERRKMVFSRNDGGNCGTLEEVHRDLTSGTKRIETGDFVV